MTTSAEHIASLRELWHRINASTSRSERTDRDLDAMLAAIEALSAQPEWIEPVAPQVYFDGVRTELDGDWFIGWYQPRKILSRHHTHSEAEQALAAISRPKPAG